MCVLADNVFQDAGLARPVGEVVQILVVRELVVQAQAWRLARAAGEARSVGGETALCPAMRAQRFHLARRALSHM